MIEYGRKGRINKRERLENDKYTKHAKAQPYKRDNTDPLKDLDEEDKKYYINAIVGDWDSL